MEVFAEVMEKGVTPVTVLVGLLGNVLSICVLRKKEIQVSWYSHIQMMLTTLLCFILSLPLSESSPRNLPSFGQIVWVLPLPS